MTEASPNDPPPGSFAAGSVVSAYRIEHELGRGGMGVVYKAMHTGLNKPVAIKVMGVQAAANAQAIARLMAEGRTLARLQHPNVVAITDCGELNGLPYLVLEFIEGGTVENLLQRKGGRLAPAEVRQILTDALEGLKAAHTANIIHRDLKPSNLLCDAQGRTRISDFGLSQAFQGGGDATVVDRTMFSTSPTVTSLNPGSGSASGVFGGTVQYMAPELHTSGAGDARSDVFAMGVIAYYLLTGRKPAGKFAPASQLVSGLPSYWDDFIDKCIAQLPEDRFQSAAEALAALRGLGEKRKVRKPTRALIAVAAGAALIAGAWWMLPGQSSPGGSGASRSLTADVSFTGFNAGDKLVIEGFGYSPQVPAGGVLRLRLNAKDTTVVATRNGKELFKPTKFSFRDISEINLQSILGDAEHPSQPPPMVRGMVKFQVMNVPPDYEVGIGGRTWAGAGALPVTIEAPLGSGSLELRQNGALKASKSLVIGENTPVIDLGSLVEHPPGELVVQLEGGPAPAGAELWVDGARKQFLGTNTNFMPLALPAGTHTVEVRGAGIETTTTDLNIVEGRPASLKAKIALVRIEIVLTGLPVGTTGTLGDATFSVTQSGAMRITTTYGKHTLAIAAPLREAYTQELDVDAPKTMAPKLLWQSTARIRLPGGKEIEVRRIDAGEYTVGSSASDPLRQYSDLPQHSCLVRAPFYVAVTELSQRQYEAILRTDADAGDPTPAAARGLQARTGDIDLPVENVSGREVLGPRGVVALLNRHLSATSPLLRADLPTEDEWEIACLGRPPGQNPGDAATVARFAPPAGSDSGTLDVSAAVPNERGLRWMLGNVAELARPNNAPPGAASGQYMVLRGGSWQSGPRGARPQSRVDIESDMRSPAAGLRLVFKIQEPD